MKTTIILNHADHADLKHLLELVKQDIAKEYSKCEAAVPTFKLPVPVYAPHAPPAPFPGQPLKHPDDVSWPVLDDVDGIEAAYFKWKAEQDKKKKAVKEEISYYEFETIAEDGE